MRVHAPRDASSAAKPNTVPGRTDLQKSNLLNYQEDILWRAVLLPFQRLFVLVRPRYATG